jgi:hypothetical protein
MKRLRDPRWFLIVIFLAIICTVPWIQALRELRAGQELQALEIFNQAPTATNLRNYERTIEAANWLGRLTRPWVHFFQFRFLKDGAEKVVIGKNGWYFYKPGLQYMLSRPPAETAKHTNDPIAAIVDFRNQLAARGIRLLLVPVPNKESIYPDYLASRPGDFTNALAPRTRHFFHELARADVEFVDLFSIFADARKADSSSNHALYLAQDTHWSPAGVDLAANAVARRLITSGWVAQGTVEYRERPAPVRRLGDILRMLKVPAIEARIQPETVNCSQIIRADTNEPYKDAGNTEILVLGDSFLRIYQEDEPKAAGFIAHLAKEMKQPLLSLVNDGGGATLVREELRAQPAFLKNKKVVVWEFVERDLGLAVKGWPRIALPGEPSDSVHQD